MFYIKSTFDGLRNRSFDLMNPIIEVEMEVVCLKQLDLSALDISAGDELSGNRRY